MVVNQKSPVTSSNSPEFKGKRPLIKPKRIVFFAVFVLLYLLSGVISMWGKIPYNMGLVSAFVIPLIFLYRIKPTRILVAYILLAVAVVLSGLLNQSSPFEITLFMRTLVFSFLMYFLIDITMRPDNMKTTIRLCVAIAVIQLPIIIFQQLTYNSLPVHLRAGLILVDFDFGTFNYKGDAAMSFFMTLVIAYLLFYNDRNHVVRHKWPIIAWLTITVLFVNAEIVKVILVFVWAAYLLFRFSPRRVLLAIAAMTLILGSLSITGISDEIWAELTKKFTINTTKNAARSERFLAGDYSRGAAFEFYLTNDFSLLGDGPSKYYNALTSTFTRGNNGHTLTFYAEVGFLGWLLSILIFYLIAFQKGSWRRNPRNGRIKVPWFSVVIFIALLMLSITQHVMNDISIMLIFMIIAKASIFSRLPDNSHNSIALTGEG